MFIVLSEASDCKSKFNVNRNTSIMLLLVIQILIKKTFNNKNACTDANDSVNGFWKPFICMYLLNKPFQQNFFPPKYYILASNQLLFTHSPTLASLWFSGFELTVFECVCVSTRWRPGLDVAGTVHNRVLRLPLLRRPKTIPENKRDTKRMKQTKHVWYLCLVL